MDGQLAREQRVEVHRDRLGVDRDDAHRAPDAHDVGDRAGRGGVARHLEGHVHALAPGPVVGEPVDVDVGSDGGEAERLEQLDAERVHLGDRDLGAPPARDERDQRADRAAAEDEHAVAGLHLRAAHVVRGDGERLDHRGVVVGERGRDREQARGRHGPVLPHAARQVHAEDLEAVAEVGRAHAAGAARAAEPERLDDDAVARRDARPGRRLDDLAERLVADHAAPRHAVVEVTLIDVQVGPADPDALDAQERLARLRDRDRRRAGREGARTLIE